VRPQVQQRQRTQQQRQQAPQQQRQQAPQQQRAAGLKGADQTGSYAQQIRQLEMQQYMLQNMMLGGINRLLAQRPNGTTALNNFAANIFTGFRQGGTGNCVTVAAIKAGMTRFGTGGIFQSVVRANDGSWNIQMRDGYKMNLTQQELNQARGLSRFTGRDQNLVNRAIFYYAAAAKRAMYENNDGWARRGFASAARTLNNGEMTREGLHFLGLDRYVRRVSVRDMHRYNAVVASNSGHAMWVSGGVVERYGVGRRGGYGINTAYAI
jgi:hypothetical protein